MTTFRLSSRSIITGFLLTGLVVGLVLSRLPHAIKSEPWFMIGFGLLWTAIGLGVAYAAWSREDEAQREAHKSAWYFGGLAGSLICLIPMAWAARLGDRIEVFDPSRFAALSPFTLVWSGALILFACQAAGMSVAWLLWWRAKR